MYNEEICNVVKAADGKFIVNVRHEKEKKKGKDNEPMMVGQDHEMIPHIANDIDEVGEIIKEYATKEGKTDKDKFEDGWKKGK